MNSLLFDLKGQVSVPNLLFLLILLFLVFRYYKKRKLSLIFFVSAIIIFLLCSTAYFPQFLVNRLESKYTPYNPTANQIDSQKIVIHVLGSGSSLDKRLPATAQLGLVGLGRLVEGIRIHNLIKDSKIICSGSSGKGVVSQAQVTKRAAILLGVKENMLETLNEPRTTIEEAKELKRNMGKNFKLIVVTDAIHMPRAIKIFIKEGYNPIAAPTNYMVKNSEDENNIKWWPSFENIGLVNYVIHEYLASIKATIIQ